MTNEIVIEADEFNEIGLTLIETTAEAAGSEEIVKLAQYTRRLQSQLAQVMQERDAACWHCWHCGLMLERRPKPRCEDCPDECNVVNCDALGCADKLAQQHLDSWK